VSLTDLVFWCIVRCLYFWTNLFYLHLTSGNNSSSRPAQCFPTAVAPWAVGPYADDTQLYVTLSSINHCDSITKLKSCLSSLHASFCGNGMALNPTKPDVILFGTPQRLKSVSADPDFLYVVQDVFEIISTNFQLCTTCNFFPNLTKKCPNSTGLLLPLM